MKVNQESLNKAKIEYQKMLLVIKMIQGLVKDTRPIVAEEVKRPNSRRTRS